MDGLGRVSPVSRKEGTGWVRQTQHYTQIRKAQILEQVFREKVDESQQSESWQGSLRAGLSPEGGSWVLKGFQQASKSLPQAHSAEGRGAIASEQQDYVTTIL